MEESLELEIRRASRNQRPLGMIMIDLDHFKYFNDNFGHEAGDLLLKELGALLRGNIRGEDIACRYGGEEFTLILPEGTGASPASARNFSEKPFSASMCTIAAIRSVASPLPWESRCSRITAGLRRR